MGHSEYDPAFAERRPWNVEPDPLALSNDLDGLALYQSHALVWGVEHLIHYGMAGLKAAP